MSITVVTVVYNAVGTLEHTIKSVLGQQNVNVDYIIVDGGSTDGSLEIIRKYENSLAYCVSEPDNGIYDAMNKAILHAKGDWIYFLGADDVFFSPTVLEQVSKKLISDDTVYYGNVLFKHSNKTYDGKFNILKLATRNISHQSIFYPNAVFKKYKFNTAYKIFADYHLNIVLFNSEEFKFKYIPITIAIFDDLGTSGSRVKDENFEKDRNAIFEKHFPRLVYLYRILRSKIANQISHR